MGLFMRKSKKFVSVSLLLVFIFGMFSAASSIPTDITEDSIEYYTVGSLRGEGLTSSIESKIPKGNKTYPPAEDIEPEMDSKTPKHLDPIRLKPQASGSGNSYGFVWLDNPDEVYLGSTYNQWVTQYLSNDGVPSTATGVILVWLGDDGDPSNAVAKGSEDQNDYMQGSIILNVLEQETWRMQIVKLGSNRDIRTWRDDNNHQLFVMGYTLGNDPFYRTTPLDLGSLTANSAWNTMAVSGLDENTTGLILFGQVLSEGDTTLMVRAVGSTDSMHSRDWEEFNNGMMVVNIDSSNQIQYFLDSGGAAELYLVAEINNSVDWLGINRDEISVSGGETSNWVTRNLTSLIPDPTNVSGVFLHHEDGSSSSKNLARKSGTSWVFTRFDVSGNGWQMGGSGIDTQNQIEIWGEDTSSDTFLDAVTLVVDKDPPNVGPIGLDETGTGLGTFWANIRDYETGVKNATIQINSSNYNLNYNGTHWVYQTTLEYNKSYVYRIQDTFDMRGNNLTLPSSVQSTTPIKDLVTPQVTEADFFDLLTTNGTFNANVTDNWGAIDSVLVNVTYYGGSARSGIFAVMRNTTAGFINNTIQMVFGQIKYRIFVNDTMGNSITSNVIWGYQGSNSAPWVSNIVLTPNPLFSNGTLTVSYEFHDLLNDSEGGTEIKWYNNSAYQPNFDKLKVLPASALIKGDQWHCTIRPKDGLLFGNIENSSIITVMNSAPQVIDYSFIPGNPVIPGVLIEDEDIIIQYNFTDVDNDPDLSNLTWYIDGIYDTQYDGLTTIPASDTIPGEVWVIEIQPFDGVEQGRKIQVTAFIESRPTIHDSGVTVFQDREGHYLFWLDATDSRNSIVQVQYILFLNGSLSPQIKWADWNVTSEVWELEYFLPDYSYLDTNLSIQITVKTAILLTPNVYEIATTSFYNLTILDSVAPRVQAAYFNPDDDVSPTSLDFYAEVEEFGSEVVAVTLFYYFRPTNYSVGGGADQESWKEVDMELLSSGNNFLLYSTSINFKINTSDLEVIFRISTSDAAGNTNPNAFDITDFPQRIRDQRFFYRPTPFPIEILLLASFVVVSVILGSYVYVRYIRKPELIGFDRDTVLENISALNESDIRASLNTHTLGIVIAFFDQRYGPIPIIVFPRLLRDNFSKLLELADRSFSGTGFADDFDIEIPSNYDFILDRGVRVSVMSWGFSLDRPQSRGGQENLTLNIFIHKGIFPLLNQFQEEIQTKVHEVHILLKKSPPARDAVGIAVEKLRTFVSAIVLAYEGIYGTTDLVLEED